jgi:hypothetical protein
MGQVKNAELEREAAWQRKAMETAIAGARQLAASCDAIDPAAPLSQVSDEGWGWLAAEIIFAWIQVRVEQAVEEGIPFEYCLRRSAPRSCDLGAVAGVLPELGKLNLEWNRPLAQWSRGQMIGFLGAAFSLIDRAHNVLQNSPDKGILSKAPTTRAASDLNDPLPF